MRVARMVSDELAVGEHGSDEGADGAAIALDELWSALYATEPEE